MGFSGFDRPVNVPTGFIMPCSSCSRTSVSAASLAAGFVLGLMALTVVRQRGGQGFAAKRSLKGGAAAAARAAPDRRAPAPAPVLAGTVPSLTDYHQHSMWAQPPQKQCSLAPLPLPAEKFPGAADPASPSHAAYLRLQVKPPPLVHRVHA